MTCSKLLRRHAVVSGPGEGEQQIASSTDRSADHDGFGRVRFHRAPPRFSRLSVAPRRKKFGRNALFTEELRDSNSCPCRNINP